MADGSNPCSAKNGPAAAVLSTSSPLTIQLSDGRDVKLAGILLPPRPVGTASTAWPPHTDAQSAFAALLPTATNISITASDATRDRYGRNRAHVCLDRGSEYVWLQRLLVEAGQAIVYAAGGSPSLATSLLEAELKAREARNGLWANAAYQVLNATDQAALKQKRLQFSLVEGRILEVARRGPRTYLNFGTNWRDDFTVIVPNTVADSSQLANGLATLQGHKVRVRGWIEERAGPAIELTDLTDLEDLGK